MRTIQWQDIILAGIAHSAGTTGEGLPLPDREEFVWWLLKSIWISICGPDATDHLGTQLKAGANLNDIIRQMAFTS